MPARTKTLQTDASSIPAKRKRGRPKSVHIKAVTTPRLKNTRPPVKAAPAPSTMAPPKQLVVPEPERVTSSRPLSSATLAEVAAPATTVNDESSKPRRVAPAIVKTTYNRTRMRQLFYGLAGLVVLGLGYGAWANRERLLSFIHHPTSQPAKYQLHVITEQVNQAKLAAIPQSSQASTPASATAAANLSPHYFDASKLDEPTPQLVADVKAAQTDLKTQHISDNGSLQHYLDLATAATNRGDDKTARTQLLDALQLAREMQILHDYYRK